MAFFILDAMVGRLAPALGLPSDQLKLVLCLLLSFPFGFLFKQIHARRSRIYTGFFVGLFLSSYLYGREILHLFILPLSCYFLILKIGRKCGKLITIYALVYLSCYHVYRQIVDYGGWTMDLSVTLMMVVPRMSSYAWCYQDGGEKDENLSADQKNRKLEKMAPLDEFMSYIFFYATVIIGPFVDYNEFQEFINCDKVYKEIPSTLTYGLRQLLTAFVFIAITAFILPLYPPSYIGTAKFTEESAIFKIIYLTLGMFLIRSRYYGGWYMSSSNASTCGLSFSGKDAEGHATWDRAWSITCRHEIHDNVRARIEDWNHSIQQWLKRYVFLRVCSETEARKSPKKASFAANIVFLVSAFWHGFYPGYYVGFLHVYLLQQVSKNIFKAGNKFEFIPKGPIQKIVKLALTIFFINYCSIFVVVLLWDSSKNVFSAFNYVPSILLLGAYLFFNITGWGQGRKSKPKAKDIKQQ